MTWSIQTSGNKSHVIKTVEAATHSGFDKDHHDRAKVHTPAELEHVDDNASVSVQASGHTDPKRTSENIQITSFVGP